MYAKIICTFTIIQHKLCENVHSVTKHVVTQDQCEKNRHINLRKKSLTGTQFM